MKKVNEFFLDKGNVVTCVNISKKDKIFCTGDLNKSLKIWRLDNPHPIYSFSNLTSEISTSLISQCSNFIFGGHQGGSINIFDLNAQKIVRRLNGHKVCCTCIKEFDKDNIHFLVTGSQDYTVKVI